MKDIWPNEHTLGCLLSIGTGLTSVTSTGTTITGLIKTLTAIATESEHTAEAFLHQHRDVLDSRLYYRFNVSQGLGDVRFDEWQQAAKIDAATEAYLSRVGERHRIKSCAEQLRAIHLGQKFSSEQLSSPHQPVPSVNDLETDPLGLRIVWPRDQSNLVCQAE
jgi:hypothetical protein